MMFFKKVVFTGILLASSLSFAGPDEEFGTFEPDVEVVETLHWSYFTVTNGQMHPTQEMGLRNVIGNDDTNAILASLANVASAKGTCQADTSGNETCEMEIELHRDRQGNITGMIASGGGNAGDIFKIKIKGPCKRIPFLIENAKSGVATIPKAGSN